MAKRAPTRLDDATRLELFCSLVAEYDVLAEALPVDQSSFQIGGFASRDPKDRWHRLLRAFALRKFVATKDQVYVGTVLESLNAVLPDDVPPADLEGFRPDLLRALRGAAEFVQRDGSSVGAHDVVQDVLYGVYLHGDHERWIRSKARDPFQEEHALWTWTGTVESIIHAVVRDITRATASDSGGTNKAGNPG